MKKIKQEKLSKPQIVTIVFFSFFISYFILARIFFIDTNRNYIYTIAQVKDISAASRTSDRYVKFEFQYDNSTFENTDSFPNDSTTYYRSNIGHRFLLKMNNKQCVNRIFSTYKIYIEKPVPDSIKEAPTKGWKELPEWAKK